MTETDFTPIYRHLDKKSTEIKISLRQLLHPEFQTLTKQIDELVKTIELHHQEFMGRWGKHAPNFSRLR